MSEYKNFHDWQNEKPALIARAVRAEAEIERLRGLIPVVCCEGGNVNCFGPRGCLVRAQEADATPADVLLSRAKDAEAEVERLRVVSDELRGWRDRAVASCIKRRCDSRDRRAGELETEVERLRAAPLVIETVDVMTVAEAIESVRQHTPPNYRVDSRDLARAAIQAMGAEGVDRRIMLEAPLLARIAELETALRDVRDRMNDATDSDLQGEDWHCYVRYDAEMVSILDRAIRAGFAKKEQG